MQDKYFGPWIGVVEYNSDPLKLGRVKVRIPPFHGIKKENQDGTFVDTEGLPWAQRIENADGRVSPLQNNIPVVCMFLDGNLEEPLILGVIPGASTEPTKYGPDQNAPGGNKSDTRETVPGPQVPEEGRNLHGFDPTVHIWGSSPDGAIVGADDTKGRERTVLLDRLGQGLLMEGSALHNEVRSGNFMEGTQRPKTRTEGQHGRVFLGNIAGQRVSVISGPDGDYIELLSQNTGGNKPSPSSVSLRLAHDEGVFRVQVVQANKVKAELSAVDDQVMITAHDCIINASDSLVNGNMNVTGNLSVSGDLMAGGRKI